VFQGNKIGTDITGALALGNTDTGVLFTTAIGSLFGGTGAGQGNIVAFNGADGVDVLSQNPALSKQVQITQIFLSYGAELDEGSCVSISLGTRSWWQRRQVEDIVQASGNRSVRPGLALPNKGMPP
jgi:hypothetical protein